MMAECFRLAEKGAGNVSPNPLVGAVLARGDRILAQGYHRKFGGPHAEVDCLRSFGGNRRGATLYVNLEPCSYYGKTPPCTDLIIRSGVRNVVVGMKDPNPLVAGRGIRKLRRAGIAVRVGVLGREARELNRKFVKHITTGMPYVHVKIAQTMDGKIAPIGRRNHWITDKVARTHVHRWRAEYDAVLVGCGTVLADNPSVTVRLVKGRNPDVVVLDGRLRAPISARLFSHLRGRRVILCVDRNVASRYRPKVRKLQAKGVTLLQVSGRNGVLPLHRVLRGLSWLNIGSVLVEGGAQVFQQFVQLRLFDELSVFAAPSIMGDGIPAFRPWNQAQPTSRGSFGLQGLTARQIGGNVLLHAYKGR